MSEVLPVHSTAAVAVPSRTVIGAALWAHAGFVLLALIIPALFYICIDGEFSANVLLMMGIVVWSQLRLAYTGLTGERRLTLLCFYVFIYVFFGVQPLLSIAKKSFPINIYLEDGLITFTACLIMLGIMGFEFGYGLPLRRRRRWGILPRAAKTLSLRMLWMSIAAVIGLTAVVMVYYGPGAFIGLRGYGGVSPFWVLDVANTEFYLVTYMVRSLAAVLLFLAVYLFKNRRERKVPFYRISNFGVAFFFLCLLNLLVSNPLNVPRLWAGSLILTVYFIAMRWKGSRSFSILASASCLTLLLLFSGLDPRHLAHQLTMNDSVGRPRISVFLSDALEGLPTDANFDAFAILASTTRYTAISGYSFGEQLLLPALFWVPRAVWPTKPIGTSDMVAGYLDLFSLNVSAPLWAEGYVNFSIPGLILFLFFFGRLARTSDDFHVKTTDQTIPAFPTVISAFFSANTFILLRGDLTSGTMYLQLITIFCFMFLTIDPQKWKKNDTPNVARH
ncbi:hypothetical protein [Geobacter sp.]|uniref:hypothetical protein n=1 Tax=Geobacter sp. TaxID=46610 RepID=UPI0027BAE059|nr:hypothetical protein [Geobacter sp.]